MYTETHFSISLPSQSQSRAVVCLSTPSMYPRSRYFLVKPKLNTIFNSENLKITIEPATQLTAYLDFKFNLGSHTSEPYLKPSNAPPYLNVNSNHTRHIIMHIPRMIELRLSLLSSTKEHMFCAARINFSEPEMVDREVSFLREEFS